jgi:perosamine synthetase
MSHADDTAFIPVASPVLGESERSYVADALAEGAISGLFGRYLHRFEADFARFCGTEHALTVSNGTTALHLAVAALGLGPGDEVLVATLTNMSTFFAVHYTGAKPIPVDIESDTLNLDPLELEAKLTERTRAIIVVHLFGHPVDMDPVLAFAKKHGLSVIEDAAQAHGATYKGKRVGGLGDIGCFSFYANKIITTGEGGMLTTSDPRLFARARSLKGLSYGTKNRFMHTEVGFNYRMTNLQAALGCGQLERIEATISDKRRIAAYYSERLGRYDCLQLPVEKPYARNVYWMYHLCLTGRFAARRDEVMTRLKAAGVETREGFIPYNMQDIFIERGLTAASDCPRASDVALRSFYLPSGPALNERQLEKVVRSFTEILDAP